MNLAHQNKKCLVGKEDLCTLHASIRDEFVSWSLCHIISMSYTWAQGFKASFMDPVSKKNRWQGKEPIPKSKAQGIMTSGARMLKGQRSSNKSSATHLPSRSPVLQRLDVQLQKLDPASWWKSGSQLTHLDMYQKHVNSQTTKPEILLNWIFEPSRVNP